jgi:hypothetical protein
MFKSKCHSERMKRNCCKLSCLTLLARLRGFFGRKTLMDSYVERGYRKID